MAFSEIESASGKQTLKKKFASIPPRLRILLFTGIPMIGLLLWSLLAAMSSPKIEPEIARNTEVIRDTYSDPLFSLSDAIGVDKATERGNLTSTQNSLALGHLDNHARLSQELLTAYKRDLLVSSEVAKMQQLAQKEIQESGKAGFQIPVDRVGDISFQKCLASDITHEDCIYLRYAGDGLQRMTQAHTEKDFQKFIDGERVYLAAIASLGDYSRVRNPDFAVTKTTLQSYRQAVLDILELNRMRVGDSKQITPAPSVDASALGRRVRQTVSD